MKGQSKSAVHGPRGVTCCEVGDGIEARLGSVQFVLPYPSSTCSRLPFSLSQISPAANPILHIMVSNSDTFNNVFLVLSV